MGQNCSQNHRQATIKDANDCNEYHQEQCSQNHRHATIKDAKACNEYHKEQQIRDGQMKNMCEQYNIPMDSNRSSGYKIKAHRENRIERDNRRKYGRRRDRNSGSDHNRGSMTEEGEDNNSNITSNGNEEERSRNSSRKNTGSHFEILRNKFACVQHHPHDTLEEANQCTSRLEEREKEKHRQRMRDKLGRVNYNGLFDEPTIVRTPGPIITEIED